jgi:hypothetical protein
MLEGLMTTAWGLAMSFASRSDTPSSFLLSRSTLRHVSAPALEEGDSARSISRAATSRSPFGRTMGSGFAAKGCSAPAPPPPRAERPPAWAAFLEEGRYSA